MWSCFIGKLSRAFSLKNARVFFMRYPKQIAVVFLLVTLVTVSGTHARAGSSVLYPATCSGDWDHSELASGAPDAGSDASSFVSDNSALVLVGDKQISCSGFAGNIPEDAMPKSFVLKPS
jgi:hypothetical protein